MSFFLDSLTKDRELATEKGFNEKVVWKTQVKQKVKNNFNKINYISRPNMIKYKYIWKLRAFAIFDFNTG